MSINPITIERVNRPSDHALTLSSLLKYWIDILLVIFNILDVENAGDISSTSRLNPQDYTVHNVTKHIAYLRMEQLNYLEN